MKKNHEIKGADTAIVDAKRSAFEHGHQEGYGQALKVCKTFMLQNGISGAKVAEFVKKVKLSNA